MSYLGNSPGVASQRVVTNRIANEGQIRISADSGYVKGYVDVIINGIDMISGVDFTEVGDGINVDMVVPLNDGDTIKLVSWIPRGLTDGYLKSEADALMTQTLGLSSFRNRIINGDMKISQRGTSFAAASGTYTLDRYVYGKSNASVVTISQSTDVPAGSGLSNSLRATVTTADTSIAAGDYSLIVQSIEGYNAADLVGIPITLSFWVRSSKTGTHCVTLRSGGYDHSYSLEYSIISANTWEKKSITISSGLNTSNGTWDFTNGLGVQLGWCMAVGSTYQQPLNTWSTGNFFGTANQVNCLDTVGNIFAITGVQLERGSVASEFEFRPYPVELILCQRYFQKLSTYIEASPASGGYNSYSYWFFKVPMRTQPTCVNTGTGQDGTVYNTNLNMAGIYTTTGRAAWGVASTASAEL